MSIAAALALSMVLADRPVIPAADQGAYKAWLVDQALDAETSFSLKPACADAAVRDVATQVVTIRNPLPGQRSQALAESVSVEGCGRKRRINVNVLLPLLGQAWSGRAGLPGESLATLGLQQNAGAQVSQVVGGRRLESCEGVAVGDAAVVARPGDVHLVPAGTPLPKGAAGTLYMTLADPAEQAKIAEPLAWVEKWSLDACGLDASVTILFAPLKDGSATAILVSPAWSEPAAKAKASPAS
jgi:hypothetical protein